MQRQSAEKLPKTYVTMVVDLEACKPTSYDGSNLFLTVATTFSFVRLRNALRYKESVRAAMLHSCWPVG